MPGITSQCTAAQFTHHDNQFTQKTCFARTYRGSVRQKRLRKTNDLQHTPKSSIYLGFKKFFPVIHTLERLQNQYTTS